MLTVDVTRTCENGVISYKIEVTSTTILPFEVFLFRAEDDVFEGVATLSGLVKDWPPYKEAGKCFYRARSVEEETEDIDDNETHISTILTNLTKLQKDYNRYLDDNKYGTTETIEIDI